MLQLKAALKMMELFDDRGRPIPFDIEFITCNRTDQTGGELVRLENVILSKNAGKVIRKKKNGALGSRRPSNQWSNSTRNLHILSSGQVRKCHIRLITELNGHTVLY